MACVLLLSRSHAACRPCSITVRADFHEGTGRCDVCKQLRKGRCGTVSAPKRCLRRPPLDGRDADSPTAADGYPTSAKASELPA